MATISKFVIEARLDPTGVRAGASQVLAEVMRIRRFAKFEEKLGINAKAAINDIKRIQGALRDAQRDFDEKMTGLNVARFSGKLTEQEFAKQGQKAAKAFNDEVLRRRKEFEARGLLSPQIEQALVSQLKRAGLAGGAAFSKSMRSAISAHPLLGNLTTTGQRAANTLLNGLNQAYQARIQRVRENFAAGLMTVQGFRSAGIRAANEYDKGLLAGLNDLRARGLATQNITDALNSQFKLAGTKAANAFVQSANRQLGTHVQQIGATMSLAITAPLVGAGVAATRLAANFDLAMRRVRVILGASEQQFASLTAQARQIGATTQFSAADAAEAMAKLAQQGLNTVEVMAAMPTVTNVAASSLTTLTDAADAATTILFGFGIPMSELENAMDQIVLLSLRSKTNLEELKTAFRTVGPVARQAGQEFTVIASVLGSLSKAGLSGTLGGTALRNILTRLTNATPKARKALEELGISAFDTQGRMRSLIDIVQQFEIAMGRTKNQEQFLRRLDTIFETRGGVGFSALLLATSGGLQKLQEELNNAGGTAERVGKVQMEGLFGAFREFINVVQELALAFAASGLAEDLKNLVNGFANIIRGLAGVSPRILKVVGVILILTATIGPLIAILGTAITMFTLLQGILTALGGAAVIGSLVTGFGALGLAIAAVAGGIALLITEWNHGREMADRFSKSLDTMSKAQLENLQVAIVAEREFLRAQQRNTKQFSGVTKNPFTGVVTKIETEEYQRLSEQISRLTSQYNEITAVIDKIDEGAGKVDERSDAMKKLAADIEKIINSMGDLNFSDSANEFQDFVNGVERSLGFLEAMEFRMARMPELAGELAKQYADINAKIAAEGKGLTDNKLKLIQLRTAVEAAFAKINWDRTFSLSEAQAALDKLPPLSMRIAPIIDQNIKIRGPDPLKEFREAANEAIRAKVELDFSERLGNQAVINTATRNYTSALKVAEAAELDAIAAVLRSNKTWAEKEKLLEEINQLLAKYRENATSAGTAGRTIAQTLEAVSVGVRGIANLADAFGDVDESVKKTIDSVADLTQSIAQLQQAKAAKDLVGIVGAGIGIVGAIAGLLQGLSGLLGESPIEQERNKIMRENSEELAKLRLAIRGIGDNVGSTIGLSEDLLNLTWGPHSRFADQVKALGFTMAELAVLAEKAGITIFDSAGNIIPQALHDWGEALRLSAEAAFRWTDSLSDLQTQTELLNRARGVTDSAEQQITDIVAIFQKVAPLAFQEFFGNVDLGDAGAMRAAIAEFLEKLFANQIDVSKFPGLDLQNSKDELIQIITAWLDAIDKMTDATDAATASMLNVPTGYKIELARFNATLAEANRNLIQNLPSPTPPTVTTPALPPGVVPEGGGTVQNVMVFREGSIVIQGSERSATQLFEEVRKEAKRRARGAGGSAADAFEIG